MPEVAGSWPEEGSQYQPGAPMEPVQQPYPQQAQYQQPYQQQYGEAPQYPAQQQYAQQQHPQASYQEQTVPQPAVFEEELASVPSEFDHLFRDSVPNDRRSISRQSVVGTSPPSAGFAQNAAQAAPPQPAATAMFNPQDQAATGYQQQPPFGGSNEGYRDGYEQLPARPGHNRTPLLIGGVVVLVAAVGLYLGLSGGGNSSGGSPSAGGTHTAAAAPTLSLQQQADQLYQLVAQAKDLRSEINGGYSELLDCNISSAQSDIDTAVSGRKAALDTLTKLDVSKISNGAELVSDLKAAWTFSYDSDNHYAKAAADFAGGASCTKSAVQHDANFQAADSTSGDSSRAKDTAADLWNQVMPNYNEPKITSAQL
ncbi:hypothetical protein KDL01_22430 [Actinospica durhamensis]|uniref:Uncharacterized protein n=1 Tax=Actinospica durhamensis TaxID=1508375 RepID=A0A941ERD1_9ACTN|nr:hypothetical protein [Actinospica durhamensis]MBR7836050.1 hypothetical protein [Actinospica durhamensis]